MLGYPDNHPGDTYCMLNLRTMKAVMSCDITWLGQTYKKDIASQDMDQNMDDDISDSKQNISPESPISEANVEEQEGHPTPGQYDDEGIIIHQDPNRVPDCTELYANWTLSIIPLYVKQKFLMIKMMNWRTIWEKWLELHQ